MAHTRSILMTLVIPRVFPLELATMRLTLAVFQGNVLITNGWFWFAMNPLKMNYIFVDRRSANPTVVTFIFS